MQHIKVDLREVSLQEKVLFISKTEPIIQVILLRVKQMDMVFIFFPMDQSIKVNLKIVNLMERDH